MTQRATSGRYSRPPMRWIRSRARQYMRAGLQRAEAVDEAASDYLAFTGRRLRVRPLGGLRHG
ncbi:hypothetical protein ABXN37_29145 [Piscinibacter sakaiensis]|uniref:hypothetical protein n=1 Tax=Piscinibacter sakaiensis TaxID=1547922 RepID=UPI00372C5281